MITATSSMTSTKLVLVITITALSLSSADSSSNRVNSTEIRSGVPRKTIADRWSVGYQNKDNQNNGCAENQIRARGRCYNKTFLFSPCKVKEQCQSMVKHSFCGFPDDDLRQHQCICDEGYQPVEDSKGSSFCTPIHRCSSSHFNREYLPGDCPLKHEYCANNTCLCAPGYRRDSVSGKCLWSVPDRSEPTHHGQRKQVDENYPWWNSGYSNYTETILIALLTSAIIITFSVIIGLIFFFSCYSSRTPEQTSSRPSSASHYILLHS